VHHIRVERSARYETLGPEDGSARELWFLLHGYGQLAASFIRLFASIDDGTRLLVAPEALNRFYLVGVETSPASERPVGATWMTKEDRLNEMRDYVAYLDAVAARVTTTVHREAVIVVLGFSQGAATASRWVANGGIRPERLVLWGGHLPPDIDYTSAQLRSTSLELVIGSRDRFISDERLADEERRMQTKGLSYTVTRYEGGHGIVEATLLKVTGRRA
jgi:predicted esterase